MVPKAAQGKPTWTCGTCGLAGLWSNTKNCTQCDAPRPLAPDAKGKGKGKGKSSCAIRDLRSRGKAKGKGKSRWDNGPGGAADARNLTADKALKDENEQLRAQLADLQQEKGPPPAENNTSAPQTVPYEGAEVSLGQLHNIYRGMNMLSPDHPSKKEVHDRIRRLQKERGNIVDAEERCAHLESIINRLFSKLDGITLKHEALEQERDAFNKKITHSQGEVDDIRKQITDAQEDKREAEARGTKNLEAKQQQSRAATETYTNDFKYFLKTHHDTIFTLGEDNA